MGLRFLLVLMVYGGGSLLAVTGFYWAAALFLWSDIFRPLVFSKSGEYPVAQFVAAMLVFSFAVNWARGKLRLNGGIYPIATAVLFVWILISCLASNFKHVAWTEFILYLKYLIPLLLIYLGLQTRREVKIVATVLCMSVAVWASQAGAHCLMHGPNIDLGIPGGQMTDRNDFTCAIVGTLPMLVYLAFSYSWRFKIPARAFFALNAFLAVAAIVFSLSRGASLGLVATLAFYLIFVSKKRRRDVPVLLILVAVGVFLLPDAWWERMDTIEVGGEQKEESAAMRWMLWVGAARATMDFPIFGLGPDGWLEVASIYGNGTSMPHSIYLKLSCELGIPGLLIYLAIVGITFWRIRIVIVEGLRVHDTDAVRLGMALIMSVTGLMAAMTFLNRPFNEYLWAWISLCNAWATIYTRDAEAARRKRKKALAASRPGGTESPPGPDGIPRERKSEALGGA